MGSTLLRSLSLRAALIAACVFAQGVVVAQGPPTPPPTIVIGQPSASLSVTSASARVALPLSGTSPAFINVYVYNNGASVAYFVLGGSSVVATTTGIPVPPGMGVNAWVGANTYLAAITASSTASLLITQSNGPIAARGFNASGSAPGGAAGGVLTGTYPNPGLASSISSNVDFTGGVGVNVTSANQLGALSVTPATTSATGLSLQGLTSQTGPYFRTFDSSSNVLQTMLPVSSSDPRAKLNLYNTLETSPTNYERGSIYFDNPNNVFRIEAQNGGTGTLRPVALQGSGGLTLVGTNAAPLASTAVIQTLYGMGTITGITGTTLGAEFLETYSPSANSSATTRGLVLSLQPNTSFNSTGVVSGGAFEVRVINSGTMSQVNGAIFNGLILAGTAVSMGNVGIAIGGQFQAVNSFSNSVAATISTAHGIQVTGSGGGSLTLTGQSGIDIAALSLATNNTHLLIGQTTVPTGNFGIYNASTSNNYFGGNIGAAVTAPTAKVHLGAGTATASTSPLKFTSGTNLTAVEAGSMEFNGTNLEFTPSATRYNVALDLSGTTGTITGTALTATCDSGTATVTGAVVGSPVVVSSTTGADIGGAFNIRGSVTSTNTVTVYVCGTGTPASLAYNVRVLQ